MTAHSPELLATKVRAAVDTAIPWLRAIDDAASARRASPERWSPRQELGHLVDSAVNNHRRIVLSALEGRLDFEGYDGDAWVATHRYHEVAWTDIVDLWSAMNRHLARAVAGASHDALTRRHTAHTMAVIGFRTYAPGAAATLADLIDDYVEHLEHHLSAIRATVTAVGRR